LSQTQLKSLAVGRLRHRRMATNTELRQEKENNEHYSKAKLDWIPSKMRTLLSAILRRVPMSSKMSLLAEGIIGRASKNVQSYGRSIVAALVHKKFTNYF